MLSKEKSALFIQKKWRAFIRKRKADPENVRELASVLGRRFESADDAFTCLHENKVIVVANGSREKPFDGHSSFYVNNIRKHLVLLSPKVIKARNKPPYRAKYPVKYHREPGYIGTYAVIEAKDTAHLQVSDAGIKQALQYLSSKGNLFVLDDIYTNVFDSAFRQECKYFSVRPFSYGFHYNCHTFVLNVLLRIIELKRKESVLAKYVSG
ncbi:hypothetical protein [Enterobacter sp. Bisph1]|uniref:hypothetical protein n=1 Tax=Enterobacter sp. Bisph1 TaxID=1274399 RepID=UPI00057BF0CE|nr:hypothetical protein [Enterobacter sp. Bisph1]